jgi:RimJ/RimL family protein N-acetyltransferase
MQQEYNHIGQPVGLLLPDWKPPPPPSPKLMEGVFCRVEPLSLDRHANPLYEANAFDIDGRNWTYLSYGPFASFENYYAWLSQYASTSDPLFFAIVDKACGKAIGVASYVHIDPPSGSIEIGHLNFSPLLQGKPAATEAMYLMMKNAFTLGYRRYEWKANALNAPSRRAAQRLGLSFEGIFRQAAVFKGRNRDNAWYAAIDQEWPALEYAFLRWLEPTNFDENGTQRLRLSDLTCPLLKQRG